MLPNLISLQYGADAGLNLMQFDRLERRQFITLLGGAAAWPLRARAQEAKRVGVLGGTSAVASTGQTNVSTFVQGLRKLGWIDGENVRIEVRWSGADRNLIDAYASDLVGLFKPDGIASPGASVKMRA